MLSEIGSPHWLCLFAFVIALAAGPGRAETTLPVGNAPPALTADHFPDRMHTFVWRNWESADLDRMAKVLNTSADNVRAMGRSMGLPPHQPITERQHQRGYISLIRRNWQLLNYDQLLTLLDWDADRLAYTLKEDDFLWIKLGRLKPDCPPLTYRPPDEAARKRCAEIKSTVEAHFGDELAAPMQPRFAFVDELTAPLPVSEAPKPRRDDEPIRFLYSYFAVYGDPLEHPELDPYPDGLLQRLADVGVNGVWLHTVLRQLAPSDAFPEFGQGHQKRLVSLRAMVDRAKRHGIKIYLYMNEPRCMEPEFFERYPDIGGARDDISVAMCSSVPTVRQWVSDALAYVFEQVPDLGGVFTITASENLTNCFSRGGQAGCPRCANRAGADVIAEVNQAIAEGVRRGNPDATVICWDWGWNDAWAPDIIRQLPDDVYLMSVSEWSLPITRGGVSTAVAEYSISAVGPGPRATRHWQLARDRGLRTLAKVQVNCTWEISAMPYLPVMNLVGQHMDNLTRAGIDGLMLSWTLGGYPSPNLQLVQQFSADPPPSLPDALARVAEDRFGQAATPDVLRAWQAFSDAFVEFPYHPTYVYAGPSQVGPANLLYPTPTGYHATMVGFPYDDLNTWRAVYPADVLGNQFHKIATGWQQGLAILRDAQRAAATPAQQAEITPAQQANLAVDLRLAEAAYTHFASITNQIRYIIARDAARSTDVPPDARAQFVAAMRTAAEDEIVQARRLFTLAREDARIGYEASNHYYYYPLDLAEKVVNCRHVLGQLAE